jgi:predicted enzyme related to lactoylglutathione lyase
VTSLLLTVALFLAEDKGRIIGIGGVFFKSPDNKQMYEFYDQKLGLPNQKNAGIAVKGKEQTSYIGIFKAQSKYFEGPLMINYMVDDLDAYLAKLEQRGVKIDPKRENSSEGRFAWIYDPDGTKIELWQPPEPTRSAKPQ